MVAAHRFSYEHHIGPIPTGMFVLHRCDVRRCVNPAHLFIGDARDNLLDCIEKGRRPSTYKQTCKQGHPFTHIQNGQRRCRICMREASRKYEATRRR